jgi:hypothetical protein
MDNLDGNAAHEYDPGNHASKGEHPKNKMPIIALK